MSDFNLAAATVVITGAATGIGRSMALAFVARGARVVIADIDVRAGQLLCDDIEAAGGSADAMHVDVSDAASVAALADRCFDQFGSIDVLCNNAGVTMRPFRASWNASLSDYAWMLHTNYLGVVHGLLSFVPRMREQVGHKHMVNTASFTALDVSPGHAPYAASKAAVIALSDALRVELSDHDDDFGVTVLYAGAVDTRLVTSERLRPEADRSLERGVVGYTPRGTQPFHTVPRSADGIGDLVVDAVLHDRPACLTHPFPTEQIEHRLDQLRAASPV